MHFLLVWSVPPDPLTQSDIGRLIEDVLAPHPTARPFPHCRVVQVPGYAVQETIREALDRIVAENFMYIMSPITGTGQFYGRLTREVAEAINQITDGEEP